MKIEPFSGFSNPMIDFSSTDLPVPDGPSNTLTSPAGSVNVTSDQMFELPNDFERFLIPTSTPPIAFLPAWCPTPSRRAAVARPRAARRPTTRFPDESGITSITTGSRGGYWTGNPRHPGRSPPSVRRYRTDASGRPQRVCAGPNGLRHDDGAGPRGVHPRAGGGRGRSP